MGFLVYCIKNNINEKKYVGLTTKSLCERLQMHISQANQNSKKSKKVAQIDDGDSVVNIYNFYREAANAIGGKPQGISRCCRGLRNKHRGYAWKEIG